MRPMKGLAAAAVAAMAATGSAQGAQGRVYRDQVGEWEISAFTAGRCSAVREYPTGTHVLVSSSSDGYAGLTVLTRAWPVRIAGSYRLTLVQGGTARSFAAEDDRSFQGLSRSTPTGAPLLAQLAEGGAVEVTGPGGTVLERVDLGGIAQALARLGPCVREIATAANFPRPAAPPAPPPPLPPPGRRGEERPARARVPLPALFSDEDYPVSAARAGEAGAVGFRLDVGTDGRVALCTVTQSSGSAALDAATCRLLRSRARFTPASNRKGKPVEDSVSGRIVWHLPEPEPEPEPEPVPEPPPSP